MIKPSFVMILPRRAMSNCSFSVLGRLRLEVRKKVAPKNTAIKNIAIKKTKATLEALFLLCVCIKFKFAFLLSLYKRLSLCFALQA